ncbi:hypothetical protein BLOT_008377 [Blomia tropicalis]|nr:hypothetical protein BLOT_008377 [Blomia tropicalis]
MANNIKNFTQSSSEPEINVDGTIGVWNVKNPQSPDSINDDLEMTSSQRSMVQSSPNETNVERKTISGSLHSNSIRSNLNSEFNNVSSDKQLSDELVQIFMGLQTKCKQSDSSPSESNQTVSHVLSKRIQILSHLNGKPDNAVINNSTSHTDKSMICLNKTSKPANTQQALSKLPAAKTVVYYHILQQLYYDGHEEIANLLLNRLQLQFPTPIKPCDDLEKTINFAIRDYSSFLQMQQGSQSSSQLCLPDSSSNSEQKNIPIGSNVIQSVYPDVKYDYGHPNVYEADSDFHHSENVSSSLPVLPANPNVGLKCDLKISCKFGSVGTGPTNLNMPHGFCIGVNDNIVIADTNNHRISIFELNGNHLFCFGEKGTNDGQLYLPRKIAMLPPNILENDKEPVFVVCDRGAKRSRMQIFTIDGKYLRGIPIVYMDIVSGLCTTQDRKIVVVDSVRSGVSILNEFGTLLYWFTCASETIEPSDVTVHEQDYYICDFKGHCVNVFNQHGVLIRKIGSQLTKFPNGIDISDMGDIVVGDSHGNRFHVTLFSSQGQLLGDFDCPYLKVSRCCGLKITSKGMIVTLAKNNNHVLVLNTLNIQQNQN